MSTLGTLPLLEEIYLEPVWWRKAFHEFGDLRPSLRHLGCFAAEDLTRINNALARQLISLQVRLYQIAISSPPRLTIL